MYTHSSDAVPSPLFTALAILSEPSHCPVLFKPLQWMLQGAEGLENRLKGQL